MNGSDKNPLVKKIVYHITVKLASPLCISKGDGALTDNDVLVDGSGMPFVPGSSLAGAMRAYVGLEKGQDGIFGYENRTTNKGRMSPLFVSDLLFREHSTTIRDSVKLKKNKTVDGNAKFDMEVVDTGAEGCFWLELNLRKADDSVVLQGQLDRIFAGWREKELRFGSKKMRGYGEIKLESVRKKEFTAENILQYKDAFVETENEDASWEVVDLDGISSDTMKFATIVLPLRLEGGISIRQYAAKKGEPDFVHVTAAGEPVIPGTSFAGAIRHRMQEILESLGAKNVPEILDEIFGYVKEKENKARVSNIIISESVLKGAQKQRMVRNGISRFESGAKNGALFEELSYIGGSTKLEIKIRRTDSLKATVGLLFPVLKDVQNGFLAVGGQTAVGRGLFVGDGEIVLDSDLSEEDCMKEAFQALRRE